jgi:hypothetical protein
MLVLAVAACLTHLLPPVSLDAFDDVTELQSLYSIFADPGAVCR